MSNDLHYTAHRLQLKCNAMQNRVCNSFISINWARQLTIQLHNALWSYLFVSCIKIKNISKIKTSAYTVNGVNSQIITIQILMRINRKWFRNHCASVEWIEKMQLKQFLWPNKFILIYFNPRERHHRGDLSSEKSGRYRLTFAKRLSGWWLL